MGRRPAIELTPEQQVVADRVVDAPIKPYERKRYATVKDNTDVLNDYDAADYIALTENQFIRRVMRRPFVAIALREAGLL